MAPNDYSVTEADQTTADFAFASRALFEVCQDEIELKSALLDFMLDGVIAHTLRGEIVYVNQQACEIFGLSKYDFVDLEPWGWVTEPSMPLIEQRIRSIRENGGMVFESEGPPGPDGSPMFTEVHAQIVRTPAHGELIVSVIRDITDRVLEQKRMRHLAFHDTLTNLPNRVLLDERMRLALAGANRLGDIVGLVYVDLDEFKPINDTLGHSTGDGVLQIIADRMRGCIRASDTVARVGGDEFVALCPRLETREDLARIAQALTKCASDPIEVDDHVVEVTVSVGLAIYQSGEASDELIARADHAMYRAKHNGLKGWEEYLADL